MFSLLVSKKINQYRTAILLFSIQIFFTTIGVEWIYSIFEEYAYITFRSILFKVLSIVLLFVFVRHKGDYLNYILVTVFAVVGSNILNFINIKKYCNLKFTLKINYKNMIPPILTIFAMQVAIQVYVNSDVTMLGYMKNDYAVGLYSVSTKIYNIVKGGVAAIVVVAIPRLSLYYSSDLKAKYIILLEELVDSILYISIPSMVGIILLSKQIILIISGKKFLSASLSLQFLAVAMVFAVLGTIVNSCVLIPAKKERYTLQNSIISALLNIGLNFILIPLFSQNGAAITTVFAEFAMTTLGLYNAKEIIKAIFNRKLINDLFSILVSSLIMFFICQVFINIITNAIVQLVLITILGVIVYFVSTLVMQNSMSKRILNFIRR